LKNCSLRNYIQTFSDLNNCDRKVDFSVCSVAEIFLAFTGPCIVIYFYSKTNVMHQFFKFILFCSSTLHVSGGLSIHYQEFMTLHTTSGICQTNCLQAGTIWNCSSISFPLASSQQNLFDIYLMLYVQF
jgi:hypothetical protein